MRRLCFTFLFGALTLTAFAGDTDGISIPEQCKTCVYATGGTVSVSAVLTKMCGVVSVVLLATLYGWFSYRKKMYLFLGGMAVCLVAGSYLYSIKHYDNEHFSKQTCKPPVCKTADSLKKAVHAKKFGHVFVAADSLNFPETDEFLPAGSEFENVTGDSDFSTTLDEFSAAEETPKPENSNYLLYQTIVLLLLSALVGRAIKYSFVRNLRCVVLLSSMVYLGFARGACPCMIMSLQQVVLFPLGVPVAAVSMLWFVGLTVTTYFFGKTWCGWLCHLGALQDFLFREKGRRLLVSERSQKIIKRVQWALLVALVIQLMLTRSIEFIHYDPFKVAFNLFSANVAGYVLLVLLLLSSVLIYRPFCRIVCPVGLILGWVTKIPGSRKLNVNETACSGCRRCERRCSQRAIGRKSAETVINTEDCILCGECMDGCERNAIVLKNQIK